jgi:purine-nucleoside phosphorylase
MRLLGVKLLVVTNAAGGLNPSYDVGNIVIIQDHYGLPIIAGSTPLRGINDDMLGPRFPAVSDAYDPLLQDIIIGCSEKLGLKGTVKTNGTYCFVSGPAYESKAESRFLMSIGGDAVGMSTVPEVIAAKHCGMKILGLSLITNKVVMKKEDLVHASHEEVLTAVEKSGKNVESLVKSFISRSSIGSYLDSLPPAPTPSPTSSPSATATNSATGGGNTTMFLFAAVAVIFSVALLRSS